MKKQAMNPTMRWTINSARQEFGVSHDTMAKYLARAKMTPGEDGKFSTNQITRAMFGPEYAEKLRLTHEQADKLELENQETRNRLIDVDDMATVLNRAFTAMRASILASALEQSDKNKLVGELRDAWDRAFELARPGDTVTPPVRVDREP